MDFSDLLQWAENSQLLLFIVNLFLTVFVIILTAKLLRTLKKYRFLLKDNENKNIEQLLLSLAEKVNINSKKVEAITTEFEEFKELSSYNLQKWALVRFKAFNNIGGDQSFALALMNSLGDGLIISSIFGREESIVYCKPVKNGVSMYPLSKEEQEAINQALNYKK